MKKIRLFSGEVAKVDDRDFLKLSKFKWRLTTNGYAYRIGNPSDRILTIRMHREILNAPKGVLVDHVNGNRLDNRRSNIRLCDKIENCQNRKPIRGKKYKGVSFYKSRGNWTATIQVNGKRISLGYFKTEKEAARIYDLAAKKYFGKFAYFNFKTGGQNEKE